MRRHPDKVLDKKGEPVPVVEGESRRGLGIGPYEQAILGNRKARNDLCEIKFTARSFSTPSMRRLLDGVAMSVPHRSTRIIGCTRHTG